MANILPTDLFNSYSSDGTTMSIDLADLNGLSAAEADATTGDGREIVRALVQTVAAKISALATADRPTAFRISSSTVTVTDGVRETISMSFDVDYQPESLELKAEA